MLRFRIQAVLLSICYIFSLSISVYVCTRQIKVCCVVVVLPAGQRSTAWVKRLHDVVATLNNEITRLTDKKTAVTIKDKNVSAEPSTPYTHLLV